MSHRPYFQGGRRGGSGGRSRGRGGQRWWDSAWRAERLRQKAAEMEVMDQNEWWGKLEQMKRGGEREMVIRRNFSRDDHQILGMAYQLGLINIMCMETETRVGNLLNTSNGTTSMAINSSTSADTATLLAKTVEIGRQAPMLEIETGLNELNIEPKQKQEKMRESDSVKAMLSFREKLLAFKMKSEFLKAAAEQPSPHDHVPKRSQGVYHDGRGVFEKHC